MNTITAPALALALAFLAPAALAAPFDKGDANKGKATTKNNAPAATSAGSAATAARFTPAPTAG
jgi:hypothetical protein